MVQRYKAKDGTRKWKSGYTSELITEWKAPEATGIPLITMPNIPRPLHGQGMQPRTIFRPSEWRKLNLITKRNAEWCCEICGAKPEQKKLHCHELFSYNFAVGRGIFERCVAVCELCHVRGIHSGRMLTLYQQGNALYPRHRVLEGIENVLSLISTYNNTHPDTPPLKAYDTILEFLEEPSIAEDVNKLIEQYGVEFYGVDTAKSAPWEQWHVVVNGKKYYTNYKNEAEWQEAMDKASGYDSERRVVDYYTQDIYKEVDQILLENDAKPYTEKLDEETRKFIYGVDPNSLSRRPPYTDTPPNGKDFELL